MQLLAQRRRVLSVQLLLDGRDTERQLGRRSGADLSEVLLLLLLERLLNLLHLALGEVLVAELGVLVLHCGARRSDGLVVDLRGLSLRCGSLRLRLMRNLGLRDALSVLLG